ncbi:ABC transporter permease [Nocardioides sp. Bht2]|uniref:ABC transporter permease n=1 Tax=Nocardioides sp. Bht2 TaxID=3392297 RepID=UPI0039B5BFA9
MMVLRRLAASIPLILLATVITFALVFFIPGDPAARIAGEGATPEQIAQVADDLGLDRPVAVRYLDFVGDAARGDLGTSYTFRTPVREMIVQRLPVTLSLTLVAVVMALLMGLPAGIYAARRAGRWQDRAATAVTTFGLATPNFVLGLLLILGLSIQLEWFPATGYMPMSEGFGLWLKHLILPGLALGVVAAAEIARQLRGSLIDVLKQDYIRTAVAKGLSPVSVVWKHALKNACMPVITVLGMQIAFLLGGTAVVESIFGIKGLGDFAVQSVMSRDLPAIQGMVIFAVLVTILASLVVDIAYGWLNPKVRTS